VAARVAAEGSAARVKAVGSTEAAAGAETAAVSRAVAAAVGLAPVKVGEGRWVGRPVAMVAAVAGTAAWAARAGRWAAAEAVAMAATAVSAVRLKRGCADRPSKCGAASAQRLSCRQGGEAPRGRPAGPAPRDVFSSSQVWFASRPSGVARQLAWFASAPSGEARRLAR